MAMPDSAKGALIECNPCDPNFQHRNLTFERDDLDNTPTLLLVEDEPVIRALLAEALREAGYHVLESHSGEDAITRLAAADIAGIITDIRLGIGPNGWDVARHARQQHPSVAVVYMTGDSAGFWAAEGVPTSIMIQKPFAHGRMLIAVTDLMKAIGPPLRAIP